MGSLYLLYFNLSQVVLHNIIGDYVCESTGLKRVISLL